jgi:hypothetical protein
MVRKAEIFPSVTMGPIRGHGCRDLLRLRPVASRATLSGDGFPDDLSVRSLCGRMVCTICDAVFSGRPFIWNLGHGILPATPIANVQRMLARKRNR